MAVSEVGRAGVETRQAPVPKPDRAGPSSARFRVFREKQAPTEGGRWLRNHLKGDSAIAGECANGRGGNPR
jgi:hypothetical protein